MESECSPRVIKVSAPGKVILHGEHSVVYGKRAVALSLDLRTYLSLIPGGNSVVLDLQDIEIHESWSVDVLTKLAIQLGHKHESQPTLLTEEQAIQLGHKQESQPTLLTEEQASELRKFLNIPDEATNPRKLALLSFMHLYLSILPHPVGLKISVSSQLPTGAGLGSSAAYAVCVSAALLCLVKNIDPNHSASLPNGNADNSIGTNIKDVNAWAFRSEQIVHGTPSGIDNSICSFGGAVNFKNGSCTPLKSPPLQVLLVNTRVTRSTKALVARVRERRNRLPKVVEPILEALDALADHGVELLHQLSSVTEEQEFVSAFRTQQELIDMNHALLCGLGVSHPSLDHLVGIASSHGLHAKLTGAGGGGFGIVVLGRESQEDVVASCRKELEDSGYQVWLTCLGAPGLTFH